MSTYDIPGLIEQVRELQAQVEADRQAYLDLLRERDAAREQVHRCREALRIQTEETIAVAKRSPSRLTVLQLEAITAERDIARDQVRQRDEVIERVRALPDKWEQHYGDDSIDPEIAELRVALDGDGR